MSELVSIRGAVTASNNEQSIASAATRLADRLYFKNGITDGNVVNITISVTPTLTAASAAQAIRESGHNVPIMSCAEPIVDGMPANVIRLMVTAYSDNPVRHIYLNGARALRKDIAGNYAVALDGPSGAGKSTVAKLVANALEITYLDTQRVTLDGTDVSDRIRTPEVSMAASVTSAMPYVRAKLLGIQRDIAEHNSVILDGRDIGTVVLPAAEFKFFLTASADVRAKRRYDELKAKGQDVVYADVYNDVVQRDKNDSTRAVAPLKQAYDAELIDSDGMTAEQVAAFIVARITGDVK